MGAKVGIICALILSGCATPQVRTVEVQVPVIVKAKPPAELIEPYKMLPIPEFLSPSNPSASSCLSPRGETWLQETLRDLVTRNRAWEAWAK